MPPGDARIHFRRLWPERHDDHVHVFANGHRYDRAERRRSLRQLLVVLRAEKKR